MFTSNQASPNPRKERTNMAEEEWKPYPLDPRYLISSEGRVKGIKGQLLKLIPINPRDQRLKFTPSAWKTQRPHYVHVAVALTFLGPRPEGMEICHGDGNNQNNRVDNLRYDTRLSNAQDAVKHGTVSRGVHRPTSKLTEEQVKYVLDHPEESGRSLGRKFEVTHEAIRKIRNGTAWKHLQGND